MKTKFEEKEKNDLLTELKNFKDHFPFAKYHWVKIDKESKQRYFFTSTTKRQMNQAVREGHTVFRLG